VEGDERRPADGDTPICTTAAGIDRGRVRLDREYLPAALAAGVARCGSAFSSVLGKILEVSEITQQALAV